MAVGVEVSVGVTVGVPVGVGVNVAVGVAVGDEVGLAVLVGVPVGVPNGHGRPSRGEQPPKNVPAAPIPASLRKSRRERADSLRFRIANFTRGDYSILSATNP